MRYGKTIALLSHRPIRIKRNKHIGILCWQLYIGTYAIGVGGLPWVMMSEVHKLSLTFIFNDKPFL